MAVEEQAPWDAGVDTFITNIDKQITKAYGMSLRDFLIDPENFADQKDAAAKVQKIRTDIEAYFTKMHQSMKEDEEELDKALENSDAQTAKIDSVIETKAALARVPYIKPYLVDFNPDMREEIVIEQYNNSIDALIAKLINVSNYVGNISGTYGKHNLGAWVFSGARIYVLTINLPENAVTVMDRLQADVESLIETAYQRLVLAQEK